MCSTDKKIVKHNTRLRNSTFPITSQCPKCWIMSRNPKYVKYHKNLSSLHWHVSHDHKDEPWVNDFNSAITQLARVVEGVRP